MKTKKITQAKPTVIKDCVITNKVWDESAVLGVNDVAKALLNLTELFKSGEVKMTGISINSTDK